MSFTSDKKIWEVYCVTEGGWIKSEAITGELTECPNVSGHTIKANTAHVIIPAIVPELVMSDTNDLILRRDASGNVVTKIYGSRDNEIHISKDNQGDYNSIAQAVANHQEPNTIFIIHPGTYYENNPIQMAEGHKLYPTGTGATTTIIGINPNSPIIEAAHNSEILNLTLIGAMGPSGCGIYYNGSGPPGKFCMVRTCLIYDCYTGVRVEEQPGKFIIMNSLIANYQQTMQTGFLVENQGDVNMLNIIITGSPINHIKKGMVVRGKNSRLHIATISTRYCDIGAEVDDGGEYDFSQSFFVSNDTSISVANSTANVSIIRATALDVRNSANVDIEIVADDVDLSLGTGKVDVNKIRNPKGVVVNTTSVTEEHGKKYRTDIGDVRVGTVDNPSKLTIGQGKDYSKGLNVLTNTNLEDGSWHEITGNLYLDDGIFEPFFAGNTANNCVYIGSDVHMTGFKAHPDSMFTLDINQDLAWEYWNGNSWVDVGHMHTFASKPYHSLTKSTFSPNVKQHVRLGIHSATDMTAKTLNGITRCWTRIRIVNDIDSIPSMEYIKLHTNSAKVNEDGWMEYYGDARPVARLPWELNITQPSNSSPGDQDVYVTDYINTGRIENLMQDGVVDRIGLNSYLPQDMDTSFPLKLKWSFIGTTGTPGNVLWRIRWVITEDGNNVYTSAANAPSSFTGELSTEVTSTVSAAETQQTETAYVTVYNALTRPPNSAYEPDIVWITIERVGNDAADTYTGHIAIIQMNVEYVKWCEGGHILAY